jgi:hypothetical protein
VAAFLDFEASSLGSRSYPIEAGWAWVTGDNRIESGSCFIRPHSSWTDWSDEAEAIHKTPRLLIELLGWHPVGVARLLNRLFRSGVVNSDAPHMEAKWANRLYAAAGIKRTWRIGDATVLTQSLVRTGWDRESWSFWRNEVPRAHRAEADAYWLAHMHARLRERQMLCS